MKYLADNLEIAAGGILREQEPDDIKLLFEAAERYVLLGVLVYTAPVAFAMGASQSTANIFKSWCRMFGGQIFLLLMNAWCLRLFITMVGTFISNPLSM